MAHLLVALVGKPSGVWVCPCLPGTLCHCALRGLAASCGVGTIVSNDLLSVRALTPVTRFSMRLSTRAGSPGLFTPPLGLASRLRIALNRLPRKLPKHQMVGKL